MTKTTVTVVTAFVIFVSTFSAHGQPARKEYRIGYFGGAGRIDPAFRQGLRELGYVACTSSNRRRSQTPSRGFSRDEPDRSGRPP